MSLAPGTRIAEYTVLKKLGEGGMGEVYLCVHARAGRQVVVKGLRAFHKGNKDLKSRFAREAEVMARLKHPNIVGIYNFLETEEAAYIVMEYVDGVSFDDVIVKRGALSAGDAASLLKPVFAAVHFAHEQGVIHRDLKPSNFMLGFDDHVRVLDFGTAKLVDQPGLTRAGTTLGTANYMSPEQLLGKDLGPQADVYALGVVLYEMTTGRLPFEAETTSELIGAIVINEPVPPSKHAPALPKLFEELILRCLAKQPQDRFATVKALDEALDDVLVATGLAKPAPKEAPVTAPPPPSAAAVATSRGPIARARFEPGPLPTRADVSMAKMVGFAGLCAMGAGALLLGNGTTDAGIAAICAAAVLVGASLHLASRNTLRLLDVVGQAVVTARSAEEEAKTLAAKLALSAPMPDHAREEPAPAPTPRTRTDIEVPSSPAGGTRRLFATDVMPAVGEALPGGGADANAEKRRARTDVWRYAPLDGAATAAVSAASGGTEVLSAEAVAKALAEAESHSRAHGGGDPAGPARLRTTGMVEVSSLIPPELRSEYAAAAGIKLPEEEVAAAARSSASGRTAVASLSDIRKVLKEMKQPE